MSIDQAARLFRDFHDREPKPDELLTVAPEKDDTLVVGDLVGVIYKVKGQEKPFIHKFKANARPRLLVSSDGRQIYVLRGAYRFTERGFIG